MPKPRRQVVQVLMGSILLGGCEDPTPPDAFARVPLQVRAFDPIVSGISDFVGGELVEVRPLAPVGTNRGTWNPTPSELATLLDKDLILIGGREPWTDTAALPSNRTIAFDERLDSNLIETDTVVTHSHGPDGAHSHRGTAPNPWLDPDLAAAMSNGIRDAYVQLAPIHQDTFNANDSLWRRRLAEAAATIEIAVNTQPTRPILFATDGYQYLQRRYGINGRHLDWTDFETLDAEALVELRGALTTHPAEHLICPEAPSDEIVEALRADGVECVVFPLPGSTSPPVDLITVLEAGGAALNRVYGVED